ncbi:CZB domain-containing protein [Georgfuchsia toluolica]|nr:CZB domain-containing protein [Georgfuchsia toluolica]
MGWVRRVLRCAVLGTPPSDDVLDPLAHSLCRFGRWFALNKRNLEKLDAQKMQRLDIVHQNMHDAIRAICTEMLAGRGGNSADLDVFEQTQSELVNLLAELKTRVLANAARHDPPT